MPPPPTEPMPRRGAFMDQHIGHLLRRAYARARKNSAEALAAMGEVSPVQASALAALMDGPLSQAELGRQIEMEPANTHSLVKRLVAAGLVETAPAEGNRRLSVVHLRPDGIALAGRLADVLAGSADATLASLDDRERRQLVELLRRVILSDAG